MKNLYLLPTGKVSKLCIRVYDDVLCLHRPEVTYYGENQHIYIVSNERFKKGDWKICLNNNLITKYLSNQSIESDTVCTACKKIILTTDLELAEDGVQIIGNEFLEWFIKNPSCEDVEWSKSYNRGDGKYYYKIITPKEDFKNEARVLSKEEVMSGRSSAYEFIDFNKKETLEEAKQNYLDKCLKEVRYTGYCDEDFEQGAKWQQERSYSEEEVLKLLSDVNSPNSLLELTLEEWFNQFKK